MKANIQGLKNGTFHLEEQIDFSNLEFETESVHFTKPIHVSVDGEVLNTIYRLNISFKGDVEFPCDRCFEKFTSHIADHYSIIYTKREMTDDDGEIDIVDIPNDATEIDLSENLIESVSLSFPMKRLHSDSCKGICECGANLNKETCVCEIKGDPRWDALKKLKF